MGVWIETIYLISSPTLLIVTPYVGVWIETLNYHSGAKIVRVTPYVGVWIETLFYHRDFPLELSLLMWECGLKQAQR